MGRRISPAPASASRAAGYSSTAVRAGEPAVPHERVASELGHYGSVVAQSCRVDPGYPGPRCRRRQGLHCQSLPARARGQVQRRSGQHERAEAPLVDVCIGSCEGAPHAVAEQDRFGVARGFADKPVDIRQRRTDALDNRTPTIRTAMAGKIERKGRPAGAGRARAR